MLLKKLNLHSPGQPEKNDENINEDKLHCSEDEGLELPECVLSEATDTVTF